MIYHIIDNIYLSDLNSAHNLTLLIINNIQIIIRLSESDNNSIYDSNIDFYNFVLEDNMLFSKEIIDYSEKIYNIILNNKEKNILIHCNQGQSRSVSAIIYYICKKYNYKYENAYNLIKDIKRDIRPNNGFSFELRKLFNSEFKDKSNIDIDKEELKKRINGEILENDIENNYIVDYLDEEYQEECLKLLLSTSED